MIKTKLIPSEKAKKIEERLKKQSWIKREDLKWDYRPEVVKALGWSVIYHKMFQKWMIKENFDCTYVNNTVNDPLDGIFDLLNGDIFSHPDIWETITSVTGNDEDGKMWVGAVFEDLEEMRAVRKVAYALVDLFNEFYTDEWLDNNPNLKKRAYIDFVSSPTWEKIIKAGRKAYFLMRRNDLTYEKRMELEEDENNVSPTIEQDSLEN